MKHTLFLTMFAAALLGSGVANAAGTLYASQYGTPDYTQQNIILATDRDYGKLVVDTPLTLTGGNGYLDLYSGATFEFLADNSGAICSIRTSVERSYNFPSVYFNGRGDVYNFTFNDGAQAIVVASAGTPITLIEDLSMESSGFDFYNMTPDQTTLTLNGKVAGETVEMGGTQFTYVGPQSSDYTFKEGEIGFTGYEEGSYALNLVVGGGSVPEPTTGSLSLLALAGLCARRRRK